MNWPVDEPEVPTERTAKRGRAVFRPTRPVDVFDSVALIVFRAVVTVVPALARARRP